MRARACMSSFLYKPHPSQVLAGSTWEEDSSFMTHLDLQFAQAILSSSPPFFSLLHYCLDCMSFVRHFVLVVAVLASLLLFLEMTVSCVLFLVSAAHSPVDHVKRKLTEVLYLCWRYDSMQFIRSSWLLFRRLHSKRGSCISYLGLWRQSCRTTVAGRFRSHAICCGPSLNQTKKKTGGPVI